MAAAEGEVVKYFTAEEIAQHNSAASAWLIIDDKVYDVTEFLDEHPGGEEVMLELSGRNATASFYDVGHSKDAQTIASQYLIGRLQTVTHAGSGDSGVASGDHALTAAGSGGTPKATWMDVLTSPTWSNFLIPVAISGLVYAGYSGLKGLLALFA